MRSAVHRLLLSLALAGPGVLYGASPAAAQSPETEVKVTVGVGLDEDAPVEKIIGGSVRYYFSDRVSIAPEILYMSAYRGDHHLLISPHLSFDFREPEPEKTFRPNVSAGGGVVLTHSKARSPRTPGAQRETTYTGVTPTMNFGFGFKFFINDRVFIEPELRMGFGPTVRTTISAGYVVTHRGLP